MKILVVHNAYQSMGGEDRVFENEIALLRSRGNEVVTYFKTNHNIRRLADKVRVAVGVIFNPGSYREMKEVLRQVRPDVVHVHNFFPQISPSVFYACSKAGVPVVLTLHNFRIICPTAILMHANRVTERSLVEGPWWTVREKVYRGSYIGTALLAGMIDLHRRAGTWARKVDRFIALTNFAARKFEQAGVPRRKIAVKPNFNLPAPVASGGPREGFLYVGRLSEEKGIATLAAAMKELGSEAALRVVGTGSEQRELEGLGSVTLLGQLSPEQVLQEMDRASALIVPSLWYEGFPMVLVEAFSRGLPVIASEIGALAELVEPHVNGLLFKTGISSDLASKIRWAVSHRVEMTEYGRRAREIYESRYTDEASYRTLMSIYEEVIREVRDESR